MGSNRMGSRNRFDPFSVSAVLGTAGAGLGARISKGVASTLDDLASSRGIRELVSSTTRSSYQAGGNFVEATVSATGKAGQIASEAATNYLGERLSPFNEENTE